MRHEIKQEEEKINEIPNKSTTHEEVWGERDREKVLTFNTQNVIYINKICNLYHYKIFLYLCILTHSSIKTNFFIFVKKKNLAN